MSVVNHPWESGRDNAPDWDEAMSNVDISHVDPHMRPSALDYDRFMAIVYAGRACGWDVAEMAKNSRFGWPIRLAWCKTKEPEHGCD